MNKETKRNITKSNFRCWLLEMVESGRRKIQIKFGAVLLFDDTKDREARTSDIALVYCGNAFIIF